jgi:hypothetical protein
VIVRDDIFGWYDQHLGENAAPAKKALLTAVGTFTGMTVPYAMSYEYGYDGIVIFDLVRELIGDLGTVTQKPGGMKQHRIDRVEYEEVEVLPAHVGTLLRPVTGMSTAKLMMARREVIERSPARAEYLVSHLNESPDQAATTTKLSMARFTPEGRHALDEFARLGEQLRAVLKQLDEVDVAIQLPDMGQWIPEGLSVHGPVRMQQIAHLVANYIALNGVADRGGDLYATDADVEAVMRICVAGRVTDDWPTCSAYAMRFLELLRQLEWHELGLKYADIHNQLNKQFSGLAGDSAYVPSPVPGRATGQWERQTIRRRVAELVKGGFIEIVAKGGSHLIKLSGQGRTADTTGVGLWFDAEVLPVPVEELTPV